MKFTLYFFSAFWYNPNLCSHKYYHRKGIIMEKKKVGFASSFGFIMAAAGSAVGLGNLWGFPYKTAKGGGAAFVLVYIFCVIFLGAVAMLTEMHLGKRVHANPVTAYKSVNKNTGWFGLLAVLIPFFITCYYSVLGGWTLKYAVNSFAGNDGIIGTFSVNTFEVILFTALFAGIAFLIIAAGVEGGIEKLSKILMPALFVILLCIVVYSLCLGSGVKEGLSFYLNPDFSKLDFSTILLAMGQAFWSLSIGMGILVTYGSYCDREINLVKSTGMICVFDTLAALLAGLAIFPAVAHFDASLLDGSKGVALIYVILPKVFGSMGFIGKIISFLFFSMVTIAALTSIMSLYEVCTQFVIQKFHANRKISIAVICMLTVLISVPVGISLGHVGILEEAEPALFGLDWLTFFDEVTNTVLMPICALMGCITVGWILKPENAIKEMKEEGTAVPSWLEKVYPMFVKFITPALIIIVEIGGLKNEIEAGNISVIIAALLLMLFCLVAYFAFFVNSPTGTNEDEKTE